jgi:hypothetical protein
VAPFLCAVRAFQCRGIVMIKVLEELLGRISREQPAKKTTPAVKPQRAPDAGDFRSVTVAPSILCCLAAARAAGTPHLLREAPRLPLQGCTMPSECSCKFRKKVDRREGDRRLFGSAATNRWFVGQDNRQRRSRRAMDAPLTGP